MKLEELYCINNINIDEYIKYRNIVKESMKYPEWLGDLKKEDIIHMLNNGSKIWIYLNDKEFVCSMMLIPSTEEDMNKFNLDLNYLEVVDYGPIFVNPKYVGNQLQYQMLQFLDKYSNQKGYKYAISTIHPSNIYSINNFIKDKFKCVGEKEFRRGKRNIYLKRL